MEARYLAMLGVVAAIVGPILALLITSKPKSKTTITISETYFFEDGELVRKPKEK